MCAKLEVVQIHADPASRDLSFKRQYLDFWCEETEGNQDISQLSHNWSLRLDRIPEAAISPINGKWNSELDSIEVELHLFKGLAFTYQAKPEDQVNKWLTDKPQVRQVIKTINFTFWFFREIAPYKGRL